MLGTLSLTWHSQKAKTAVWVQGFFSAARGGYGLLGGNGPVALEEAPARRPRGSGPLLEARASCSRLRWPAVPACSLQVCFGDRLVAPGFAFVLRCCFALRSLRFSSAVGASRLVRGDRE